MNGCVIVVLILLSNSGALMIARIALGGTLSAQVGVGFLVIATTVSISLAWINIRRLQVDQHRKWMLRAWFYVSISISLHLATPNPLWQFGSIITERMILGSSMAIIPSTSSYYYAMPCSKIVGTMAWSGMPSSVAQSKYPTCEAYLNGTSPHQYAVVQANSSGGPENSAALLDISFGMSIWLAILIHAVGIEVYV
jgi:hypothetical protein